MGNWAMLTPGRPTDGGSGTFTCLALALQVVSFWVACEAFPTYPKAIPSGTQCAALSFDFRGPNPGRFAPFHSAALLRAPNL